MWAERLNYWSAIFLIVPHILIKAGVCDYINLLWKYVDNRQETLYFKGFEKDSRADITKLHLYGVQIVKFILLISPVWRSLSTHTDKRINN